MLVHEHQSISRGERHGVQQALLNRLPTEQMVVVLDSECVFKGVLERSTRCHRHASKNSSEEVDHKDLWEQILWLREGAGDVQVKGCHSILTGRAMRHQMHWPTGS